MLLSTFAVNTLVLVAMLRDIPPWQNWIRAAPARLAAGHAPPARRGRRVRVPRAFKRPRRPCGGDGGGSNSELPQAGFP